VAAQVFILSSPGVFDELCPEASGRQAALVLFRDENGAISFNSELGQQVLRTILRGAVMVGSDAELNSFCDGCDPKEFHAAVLGFAGLCVYGPDTVFMDNVKKCKTYIRDVARSKLLMKYGKAALPLAQPLLHHVFFERKLSADELSWVTEHSKAVAIWRCIAGAEVQPIFFGHGQQEILTALKACCELQSVNLTEVRSLTELPTW